MRMSRGYFEAILLGFSWVLPSIMLQLAIVSSKTESGAPFHFTETSTLEAIRTIEQHIKDAELGSARFQAFADYADYLEANVHSGLLKKEVDVRLIEETIRQRKNGVMGYKREFGQATKLYEDLYNSIYTTSDDRINALHNSSERISRGQLPEVLDLLMNIKNQAIEKKS